MRGGEPHGVQTAARGAEKHGGVDPGVGENAENIALLHIERVMAPVAVRARPGRHTSGSRAGFGQA